MELFRNHKTKKKRHPCSLFQSLCVSMASIVLSLIMLVGTTMAWFTDSVTTGTSTIVAGNIGSATGAAFYTVSSASQATGYAVQGSPAPVWTSLSEINDTTPLFDPNTHFIPGVAQTVYLRLFNDGTLKTRYRISLQLVEESCDLSQQLMYGYKVLDNEAAVTAFCASNRAVDTAYDVTDSLALHNKDAYAAQRTTCTVVLDPGATKFVALSLYMLAYVPNPTASNTIQQNPSVKVQMTLITTQIGEEGAPPEAWDGVTATATEALTKTQNENGEYTYKIASPADLAGVANILRQNALHSVTIELNADLDMNNQPWTPIDTTIPVIIKGNGHTIYNLNASVVNGTTPANAGLFGSANTLKVTSLRFAGGKAVGTNAAGMLAGAVTGGAELTAVEVESVTVQAPDGHANPMIGTGPVTEDLCKASNYTTGVPAQGGQTQ